MRDSPTIAIVGASARAAAFSALRAGYRIVTADLFADADLQQCCPATKVAPYPEGLRDWLAQCECDGWMYTGALENRPKLVDAMAAERQLWGMGGKTLVEVRSPLTLAAVLSKAGLLFPETRINRKEILASEGQWLAKTYQGSSGTGVQVLEKAPEGAFVQQQVPGISLSAVYVGQTLLGVTRQLVGEPWTRAGEFQYCGSIAPWPVSQQVKQQLYTLGEVLNGQFGLKGLYGVDLMLEGEKLWTIEVNPRYTAAVEVVERAYGINAITHHTAAHQPAAVSAGGHATTNSKSRQSPEKTVCSRKEHVGKAILFAKSSNQITPEQTAWLCAEAGDFTRPQLADIPAPGTQLEPGNPVLTIFAEGETCTDVAQKLKQRVRQIEQQLFKAIARSNNR
ncbi:MAG: ATP-grasp domain-containing protein [Planctomycetes bacterium]|nr:ATP-grasp domain-containing protein [Planctomycetota bacterium]